MTDRLDQHLAELDGAIEVPRQNGELAFSAPWEARAFALAVAVVERLDLPWDDFRSRLMAEIAENPDRPYYESWTAALESLVLSIGLTTSATLDAAQPTGRGHL